MNTGSCIAGIFEIQPNVFRARLLFDGILTPVECLCQGSFAHVYQWLTREFPLVVLKTPEEFQEELDHIAVFQCRSNVSSYVELPSEQMSDEDFEKLLADMEALSEWLEQETNALEEKYRALLPIPPVDN